LAKFNKGRVTFETEATQPAFGYVKGEARWAKILEPDDYGKFSINLYGDAIEELVPESQVMLDAAVKEIEETGKEFSVADILKEDDEGKKFLPFKLKAVDSEGNPNKITMYDASGKKVDDWSALVGNGSIVKVKYRVAPYYVNSTKVVGLSFRFYAVQVIKLVEYSGGDSGFGDETDGGAPFDAEGNPNF